MFLKLKGVFARSRRDFSIDQCAIGFALLNSGLAGGTPTISLYNNSLLGDKLAVYAILARHTPTPPTVAVIPNTKASKANVGSINKLDPSSPGIAGAVTQNIAFSLTGLSVSFNFEATGENWLTNGDAPIHILPAGWALSIVSPVGNASLYCGFIWGVL